MQSRMDRYYDMVSDDENINEETDTERGSRTQKNDQLYKEVSSLKIENFDVNSNVSVIGKSSKNIDIHDVQDILDKRYHEKPKKKSIGDSEMKDIPKINLDETREYDINVIMEKARLNKQVNYEEDRLKKLRNTQYDILKNLDIDGSKKNHKDELDEPDVEINEKTPKKTDKELLSLIDTITTKELISEKKMAETTFDEEILKEDTAPIKEVQDKAKDTILDNTIVAETGSIDSLDALKDLKGDSDNTRVKYEIFGNTMASETGSLDPLDILSDLRGDNENTRVLGINELREKSMKNNETQEFTKNIETPEVTQEVEKIEESKEEKIENVTEEIEQVEKKQNTVNIDKKLDDLEDDDTKDQSITSTMSAFTKTYSFDDFADLREDMKITKMLLRILIVIIILVFMAGCVFLANKFLGLGLF